MKIKSLAAAIVIGTPLLFGAGDMAPISTEVAKIENPAWSFELEPYLMAASMSGDTSIGRVEGIDIDVEFSDILETFQMGVMIHMEAHHESGFGIWIDYGFMDLAKDVDTPLNGITTMGVRQAVTEIFALYRQPLALGRVDYMLGARLWNNDFDLEINPAIFPGTIATDMSKDWIDVVIGANWLYEFRPDWSIKLRGDVGGFGLESDFTAAGAIGVEYAISDLMSLDIQYKATWVNYTEGTEGQRGYFAYDAVTHGPIVGLKFKF